MGPWDARCKSERIFAYQSDTFNKAKALLYLVGWPSHNNVQQRFTLMSKLCLTSLRTFFGPDLCDGWQYSAYWRCYGQHTSAGCLIAGDVMSIHCLIDVYRYLLSITQISSITYRYHYAQLLLHLVLPGADDRKADCVSGGAQQAGDRFTITASRDGCTAACRGLQHE